MIDIKSLKHAIVLQEKIEALRAELNSILGVGFSSESGPAKKRGRPAKGISFDAGIEEAKPKRKKRRKMSAEGRARIIAAQKARWAKVHKEQKKAEK